MRRHQKAKGRFYVSSKCSALILFKFSKIEIISFFSFLILYYNISRTAPREGAYIHGLFMEGARWDSQSGIIMESRLKELFPPMPVINVRVNQIIITCIIRITNNYK